MCRFHTFSSTFILTIVVLSMVSCSTVNKDVVGPFQSNQTQSLEGSWKLSKYINHLEFKTAWESYGPEIIYQKHITPTHFTWFKYNSRNDILEGAGGGTYKFDGLTYTEYIEFFHPPGTTLLGQAIPFDVKFENGVWYHTGYTKDLEFDPRTGEVVIVDTTKIEEQWVRMEEDKHEENEISGTWKLIGYKMDPADPGYVEYPDFVGYLKLITSEHFVWIKYNKAAEGGEVLGLGSGTWEISGDRYTEHINIMHPAGSRQVNTTISFDFFFFFNKWKHFGYVRRVDYDDKGRQIVLDSTLVDEIWQAEPDQ